MGSISIILSYLKVHYSVEIPTQRLLAHVTHGESDHCPPPAGNYSLSVCRDTNSSGRSVKHYRIHRLPNGWFYISPGTTFPSLSQLVEHYSGGYGLLSPQGKTQKEQNYKNRTGCHPSLICIAAFSLQREKHRDRAFEARSLWILPP